MFLTLRSKVSASNTCPDWRYQRQRADRNCSLYSPVSPSEFMQVPHVSGYSISSDHRQSFSHFCLRETKETEEIGSDVIPHPSTADVCPQPSSHPSTGPFPESHSLTSGSQSPRSLGEFSQPVNPGTCLSHSLCPPAGLPLRYWRV